jgi:hypothetical protein
MDAVMVTVVPATWGDVGVAATIEIAVEVLPVVTTKA